VPEALKGRKVGNPSGVILPKSLLKEMGVEEGPLKSLLAGPRRLARYGDPSVWGLAAAYCGGLLQKHPFADGNKRAGLLAARVFLVKNSYRLEPEEAVAETRQAATGKVGRGGKVGREELAEWLEASSEPIPEA
jgi:death-on-curing protein